MAARILLVVASRVRARSIMCLEPSTAVFFPHPCTVVMHQQPWTTSFLPCPNNAERLSFAPPICGSPTRELLLALEEHQCLQKVPVEKEVTHLALEELEVMRAR